MLGTPAGPIFPTMTFPVLCARSTPSLRSMAWPPTPCRSRRLWETSSIRWLPFRSFWRMGRTSRPTTGGSTSRRVLCGAPEQLWLGPFCPGHLEHGGALQSGPSEEVPAGLLLGPGKTPQCSGQEGCSPRILPGPADESLILLPDAPVVDSPDRLRLRAEYFSHSMPGNRSWNGSVDQATSSGSWLPCS